MVSAAAGNAQASVSFSAPASNGNSAITGYTVVSTPSGGVDRDAGSPATTHTVTGLANGTLYSFTVTASNAAGTGRASAPSNGVTPLLMTPVIGPPSATYVKSGAQVSYLVSYTAASSITLAAADLTLARTGTANGTLTVSGSGSTGRTVTVSDITGDGTLGITVGAGTASTADSILATPSAPSAVFTVDNTAPALSVSTLADGTVTFDDVAPSLAVTDPAGDLTTTLGSYQLTGSVSDQYTGVSSVEVAVDGVAVVPSPTVTDGVFQLPLTFSEAKSYAVTVTATDAAGNPATVQRNIVYRPVSIGDALRALQIAVGLTAKTAADGALDVGPLANDAPHPDGIIDVSDAVAILHRLVGLVTW